MCWMGGWILVYEVKMKLSIKEKLIFIASFLWMLHWGTNVASLLIDTFLLKNSVRLLPFGL